MAKKGQKPPAPPKLISIAALEAQLKHSNEAIAITSEGDKIMLLPPEADDAEQIWLIRLIPARGKARCIEVSDMYSALVLTVSCQVQFQIHWNMSTVNA